MFKSSQGSTFVISLGYFRSRKRWNCRHVPTKKKKKKYAPVFTQINGGAYRPRKLEKPQLKKKKRIKLPFEKLRYLHNPMGALVRRAIRRQRQRGDLKARVQNHRVREQRRGSSGGIRKFEEDNALIHFYSETGRGNDQYLFWGLVIAQSDRTQIRKAGRKQ